MADALFLTGATGFIGSSLLRKWLDASDAHITLLARPKRGATSRERVRALLDELYEGAPPADLQERVSLAEGDLTAARFGLAYSDYRRLAEQTTHILHCAAAVRFDLPLEVARQINCGGTRSALDLAGECRRLQRLDYVGTAYVAGKRRGLIREDELDQGQEHNNTYERSKMEAELLVRAAMRRLPIAIHRPTIVIGDKRTGRISPVSAIFRLLALYAQGRLPVLPGDPATPMDLVSLDYAADAMFAICRDPASLGGCYHVSAGTDNLTTLAEVAELAAGAFGRERFRIMAPGEFERGVSRAADGVSEEERKQVEEIRLYRPYLTGDWRFDDTHTRAVLRATGLTPPRVRDYFAKIATFVAHRA